MTPPLVLDCGAPVFSVAFCGEACLATGGYDERLSLWNLRTKEVRQVAEPPRNDGYAGCIRQISFDSRSRSVTYINPSNQLRRIDPQTFGKNKETLPFHHVVDYSAAQSADIMVVATINGDVMVCRRDGTAWRSFRISAIPLHIALSPSAELVAVVTDQSELLIVETSEMTVIASAPIEIVADAAVLFGSGGTVLFVNCKESVTVFSDSLAIGRQRYHHEEGLVYVACFSERRGLLITGDSNGRVSQWDSATSELLARHQYHGTFVRALALSKDHEMVASGSEDGTVCVASLVS